ncbi:MAG: beta-lactamase family protein [Myxococcales bacterium]|nr:beta-lactamase family protein [Myxococcales bacterium]
MSALVISLALLLHAAPPIDPEALREQLDELVPARLQATGIPGVVVSVVQDDRVLLVGGWGWADLERGEAMDGERTVVRVASISKTFTATAIAQLEAEGRLSIDDPVNEHLPAVALPERFEPPVTLRHLLSHTAGIINNNVGRVSRTPPSDGLAAFLGETMPPQVRPPGRVVLYSNHGNALAGLVVEQVGGTLFAEHVERSLLEPLGMDHSSFELRPELEDALATGYVVDEHGRRVPYEYLYFRTVPASTLHTTAADMARFMIMHLEGGRFEGRTVLHPEAHRRMRRTQAVIHPALPSYHYAFLHGTTAGHRSRSHGGSVPAFLSRVVLLDEAGVGIFVAQNGLGPSLHAELVDAIVERFLPPAALRQVVAAGDGRPEDPEALVGRFDHASKHDTPAFTRGLARLLEPPLRVELDDEGFLRVDGERFVRTGDRVFERVREAKEPEVVVFVADADGVVRWVHRGASSAERMPWHRARWIEGGLLGAVLLVLGVGALGGRRRPRLVTLAARLALVGSVVPLLYAAWVDAGQEAYLRPLRFGMPGWLPVLRMAVPLGAGLGWVAAWRERGASHRLRVALLVAVAATALPLWELSWRPPEPGLVSVPSEAERE